jgi:hypothetical protein
MRQHAEQNSNDGCIVRTPDSMRYRDERCGKKASQNGTSHIQVIAPLSRHVFGADYQRIQLFSTDADKTIHPMVIPHCNGDAAQRQP